MSIPKLQAAEKLQHEQEREAMQASLAANEQFIRQGFVTHVAVVIVMVPGAVDVVTTVSM